jgi:ribonuclease E
MELSRQRLRPSLSEGSHVTCPRCNGTGHIRDTESSALQVLRIIQEEAMKENSAAIHVQAPVDVAAFLLNEKRGEILKIETRHRVTIILIPNKHLETPHYKLERIKHDDPRLDDSQASYAMAEQAETDISYAKRQKEEVKSRQEAVVKGITPDQPAPIVERKTEAPVAVAAPAVTAPKPGGFFGWLKSLFSGDAAEPVAAPAPVVEEKPATQRDRNDRNARGQRNRNRGGRGGRDREERGEERAAGGGNRNAQRDETSKTNEAAPANARAPKPQREPREAREPREQREPRDDNRQENRQEGRQRNERPARPPREERKEQVAEVKAEELLPVTAVADTSVEGAAAPGVETGEGGEQKERRRRRRGGRNRNRRDRDENAQSAEGGADEGGDDAGEDAPSQAHAAPVAPAQPELAFDAPAATVVPAAPVAPAHKEPVEAATTETVAHVETAPVVAAPVAATPAPTPVVAEAPVVHTPAPAAAPVVPEAPAVAEVAAVAHAEPVAVAAPVVPVAAEVKVAAPTPIVVSAPKVDLSQVLAAAGLVQANTDPIKLRAAQEAAALIVPKAHVPRERKPAPVVSTEPLVQVHTRR